MAERTEGERTRALIERLDQQLRKAEHVRNRADEAWRERPFYPDRRKGSRVSRTMDDIAED